MQGERGGGRGKKEKLERGKIKLERRDTEIRGEKEKLGRGNTN